MIDCIKKITTTLLVASGISIVNSWNLSVLAKVQLCKTDQNKLLIAQKLGEIEKKIELSEVPTTVLSSAMAVSGGQPTKAQVQINPDGTLVYELGGQNQQGFDFEIEMTSGGEIIEIDEQVEASAVPEQVMKALKHWLPQAEVVSTWRSTRYQTFDYYYEIVISEEFWVEIPADASTVKINPLSTLHGGES